VSKGQESLSCRVKCHIKRSYPSAHLPDPILSREDQIDPEREALLADSVGLAQLR
jgi:hypothetical protein